jgi:hypothetical protein
MLILVAVMVGGGMLMRKSPTTASLNSQHSHSHKVAKSIGGKNNARTAKELSRKDVIESPAASVASHETTESVSSVGEDSEIEKLSSVIPKTIGNEQDGRVTTAKIPVKKKNRVAGVSIQDYVSLKRNSLPLPEVTRDDGQGLRVFLNCMELKNKGLEYTGKAECDSILGGLAKR